MINSLFMLGSSYNKDRKISIIFLISWIVYMFINYDFSCGYIFPIVNGVVFIIVTIGINLIKNRFANAILSIFSILIWSVIIDIICYFMFPTFSFGQNLLQYVYQGILFNGKYIYLNTGALLIVNCSIYVIDKVVKSCLNSNLKEKKYTEH